MGGPQRVAGAVAGRAPRPADRPRREELAAARESGDEAALAIGHIALAGAAVEEGDLETWLAESAAAEAIARRRRLVYVEFVLHFVRLNLAAPGR